MANTNIFVMIPPSDINLIFVCGFIRICTRSTGEPVNFSPHASVFNYVNKWKLKLSLVCFVDKSKAATVLPTVSKRHQTLINAPDTTNRVTNKSSQKTLAPNSLKKAAGKIRSRNDMSRWDRFNSQGGEGSGLTSAKDVTSTRNNPSGEKRREPLPCHGRKELLNFLQETMSGPVPNHEVSSKAPVSMRKRVAALPGNDELVYLTPMPLRFNGRPEAGSFLL